MLWLFLKLSMFTTLKDELRVAECLAITLRSASGWCSTVTVKDRNRLPQWSQSQKNTTEKFLLTRAKTWGLGLDKPLPLCYNKGTKEERIWYYVEFDYYLPLLWQRAFRWGWGKCLRGLAEWRTHSASNAQSHSHREGTADFPHLPRLSGGYLRRVRANALALLSGSPTGLASRISIIPHRQQFVKRKVAQKNKKFFSQNCLDFWCDVWYTNNVPRERNSQRAKKLF